MFKPENESYKNGIIDYNCYSDTNKTNLNYDINLIKNR